jgi:hypothetical protein
MEKTMTGDIISRMRDALREAIRHTPGLVPDGMLARLNAVLAEAEKLGPAEPLDGYRGYRHGYYIPILDQPKEPRNG